MTKEKGIEVLVRTIIQTKGKILVCKKVGKRYYFFPGGHIEIGESAINALVREIKEELGIAIKKCSFIGGSEHTFAEEAKKYHEINLTFLVSVKKVLTKSKENHLQFSLFNKKELSQKNVLPLVLKKAILKWLKDKKMFWVSQI